MGEDTPKKRRRAKDVEPVAFDGFEYANPDLGFTQIGNGNFAILARLDNLSEAKIIWFLMRNTWGYGEYDQEKWITVDEFVNGRKRRDRTRIEEGCGLKESAVKEGLALALAHGYVTCIIDASDKGRIKKLYMLKMNESTKSHKAELEGRNVTPDSRNATVQGRNVTTRGVQRDPRSEKETPETNLIEINLEKEREAPTVQQANTSSLILSDEESLIHHWYAELATRATPLEVNARLKGYWKKVSEKVKTREQFVSLYEYTRQVILNDPKMTKKIVHPGNLVNELDDWSAKNETATNQQEWYADPDEPEATGELPSDIVAMLEEMRRRANKQ